MNPKHQDLFIKLVESGALDTQNGKVIMHFNQGELMRIDAETVMYKHPAKLSPTITIGVMEIVDIHAGRAERAKRHVVVDDLTDEVGIWRVAMGKENFRNLLHPQLDRAVAL